MAEPADVQTGADVPVKVSVIVPVYNPGPYVEPCIDSLLAQTMPADELELIFVDDGSTDDSLARLEAVAAKHPHVRVIPIPNSGWPGKPRNIGADSARGDYVMFVDQDDTMEPEALERMHTLAAAHGADVVLGKVISDFRGVNHEVYRETRPSCTVFDAPLMESLTPHKMFRRTFLQDKGIRYPEGPRRLEDQLYMAKAYFGAQAATIIGDYVCYRYLRRPDGGNAGSKRFDPAVYYANLREVLDVVDQHTEPGEARDAFYRRFLRVELLGRLGGGKVAKHPEDYFEALHREVRTLLEERFPPSVDAGMGAAMRVRAGIVRRADRERILTLAREYNAVKAVSTLQEVRVEGGAWKVGVEVRLTYRGKPLALEEAGERLFLPRAVVGDDVSDDERRVDDQVQDAYGDVVVRHRDLRDEWYLPEPLTVELDRSGGGGPQLVWRGTVTLDPATAAGGRPLRPGKQDLYVRVGCFMWARTHRLGAVRRAGLTAPDLLVEAGGRVVERFDTDPHKNLSLNVAVPKDRARTLLARTAVRSGTRTRVELAPTVRFAEGAGRGTLALRRPDGHRTSWPLTPVDEATWVAEPTDGSQLRPGTYELTMSAPGPWGSVRLHQVLVVTPFGVSVRRATAGPTAAERLTALAARARRAVRR